MNFSNNSPITNNQFDKISVHADYPEKKPQIHADGNHQSPILINQSNNQTIKQSQITNHKSPITNFDKIKVHADYAEKKPQIHADGNHQSPLTTQTTTNHQSLIKQSNKHQSLIKQSNNHQSNNQTIPNH